MVKFAKDSLLPWTTPFDIARRLRLIALWTLAVDFSVRWIYRSTQETKNLQSINTEVRCKLFFTELKTLEAFNDTWSSRFKATDCLDLLLHLCECKCSYVRMYVCMYVCMHKSNFVFTYLSPMIYGDVINTRSQLTAILINLSSLSCVDITW